VPAELAIPLEVRVELAHAHVQVLADRLGVDLLHIKGPAVDPSLRGHRGGGSDADVIVRPAHVRTFMRGLVRAGWQLQTRFTEGSAFEHAAGLYHPSWGLLDVHRTYPGLHRRPEEAFAALWERRREVRLAAIPCAVPDLVAQRLVLLLHAARSGHRGASDHADFSRVWTHASPEERAEVVELAHELGAEVGLAAATGDLDAHAHDPEARLWRLFAEDHSRLDEWRARLGAAPTARAKVSVLGRSLVVNRYFLSESLGRPATRGDVAREFVRRLGHAGSDTARLVRRRLGGPS